MEGDKRWRSFLSLGISFLSFALALVLCAIFYYFTSICTPQQTLLISNNADLFNAYPLPGDRFLASPTIPTRMISLSSSSNIFNISVTEEIFISVDCFNTISSLNNTNIVNKKIVFDPQTPHKPNENATNNIPLNTLNIIPPNATNSIPSNATSIPPNAITNSIPPNATSVIPPNVTSKTIQTSTQTPHKLNENATLIIPQIATIIPSYATNFIPPNASNFIHLNALNNATSIMPSNATSSIPPNAISIIPTNTNGLQSNFRNVANVASVIKCNKCI